MRFTQIILSTFVAVAAVVAMPSETIVTRDLQPIKYVEIAKADGRIYSTDDSLNGFYIAHNETHSAFYGEVSAEQIAAFRLVAGPVPDEFTCVPSCNGQQHSASDISTAEQGLQGFLGSGLSWRGSIYYLYNSVFAFGCDYGNGQSASGSDYQACYNCVDRNCGNTQGGWDNIHNWKVTYGREFGSFGC